MRPCRSIDATMFCISIIGSCLIRNPSFSSSLITVCTALIDSFSLFAPVHTIFPDEKISVAVFGVASLKTRPGNCAGLYSVSGKAFWIWARSSLWFIVTEATTFWISIVGSGVFVCSVMLVRPLLKLGYKVLYRGL